MSGLSFRRAGSADVEQLLRLVEKYYTCDEIPFSTERLGVGLKLLLENDAFGLAFFMEAMGICCGYFIVTFGFDAEFGGPLATLTDLYFEPEFRRQGLGRIALCKIENVCRERGALALELQVERHNGPAQRLYRSSGFQELDRIPMWKDLSTSG